MSKKNIFRGGRFTSIVGSLALIAGVAATASVADAWNGATIALGSHTAGLSGWAYAEMTVDVSGNTLTAFDFSGTVDVDPGSGVSNLTAAGQSDAGVSKFDTGGALTWTYRTTGINSSEVRPSGIATDAQGNVYVAGGFYGTVDFDPTGSSNDTLTAAATGSSYSDLFILKLSSAGAFQWVRHGETPGNNPGSESAWAVNIKTDPSGDVIIGGMFGNTPSPAIDFVPGSVVAGDTVNGGPNGGSGVFAAKFASTGTFQWAYATTSNLSDPQDPTSAAPAMALGMDVTATGAPVLFGVFYGPIDFDNGSGQVTKTPTGFADAFILKLTTTGQYQAVTTFGGASVTRMAEGLGDVSVGPDGAIVVTGVFTSGAVDFDPGAGTTSVTNVGTMSNTYVAKYDSSLAFQWVAPLKPISGSGFREVKAGTVEVDSSGNVYASGTFLGTVDLDPGSATDQRVSVTSVSYDPDAYVMRLSATGTREWVQVLGNSSKQEVTSLVVREGYLSMYGSFSGTLDFDPSAATYNVVGGGGSVFLWRVDSATATSAPVTLPTTTPPTSTSAPTGGGGGTGSSGSGTGSGASPSAAPTNAELTASTKAVLIDGAAVDAGGAYQVAAGGFTGGETVNAFLVGYSSRIGTVRATSAGRASMKVKIPATATGKKTLVLFGATSRHGVKQSVTVRSASALPTTGSDSTRVVWFAALLVGAGLILRRRRQTATL